MSLVEAFRQDMVRFARMLDTAQPGFQRGGFMELVRTSPSLQRRALQTLGRQETVVAGAIAELMSVPESDPVAGTAARALLGACRSIVAECHHRLAGGEHPADVAAGVETDIDRVFALLDGGLPALPTPSSDHRGQVPTGPVVVWQWDSEH